MALSICKPHEPLPDMYIRCNWQEFKEQLTWFLAGTESSEKTNSVKIEIMLSHAGKGVHKIYKTLPWTEPGNKIKFDKVVKAFRDYCHPHKNILYERHKFCSLKQEDSESIDAYNTRLKVQIDHCDYKREGWPEAVKTEMIRDKFVFGIRDENLKECLLRETDILLSKLVGLAQRTESLKQHIREMTGAATKSMDTIRENSKQ